MTTRKASLRRREAIRHSDDAVGQRLGTSATFVEVPLDVLGDDQDRKKMFEWFTTLPSYRADFERTRELAPDVENLSTWLTRQALDDAR